MGCLITRLNISNVKTPGAKTPPKARCAAVGALTSQRVIKSVAPSTQRHSVPQATPNFEIV